MESEWLALKIQRYRKQVSEMVGKGNSRKSKLREMSIEIGTLSQNNVFIDDTYVCLEMEVVCI